MGKREAELLRLADNIISGEVGCGIRFDELLDWYTYRKRKQFRAKVCGITLFAFVQLGFFLSFTCIEAGLSRDMVVMAIILTLGTGIGFCSIIATDNEE